MKNLNLQLRLFFSLLFTLIIGVAIIAQNNAFTGNSEEHPDIEDLSQDSLPINQALLVDWRELLADVTCSKKEIKEAFEAQTRGKKKQEIPNYKEYLTFLYPDLEDWIEKEDKAEETVPNYYLEDYDREKQLQLMDAYDKKTASLNSGSSTANWTLLGPNSPPGKNSLDGIGRIQSIAFHPLDSNHIWVSSPTSGLWETTDGGDNWTHHNKTFTIPGVSVIAIDQNHPDTMFAYQGGHVGASGMQRSFDGGQTWTTISPIMGGNMLKMRLDPNNSNIIYIQPLDNGLWKTNNALAPNPTWTKIAPNSFDFALKPDNSSVVYVLESREDGDHLFKSTDGGLNWIEKTVNVANPGLSKYGGIATTAAQPNHLYYFTGFNENIAFEQQGILRSIDNGETFSLVQDFNVLTRDVNGSFKDLTLGEITDFCLYCLPDKIAVSPYNEDEIILTGVWMLHSKDGGASWVNPVSSVHADHPPGDWNPVTKRYWDVSDGGVWKELPEGMNYEGKNNGLAVANFFFTDSSLDGEIFCGGAYDNGTFVFVNGEWNVAMGGDGFKCVVNKRNPNITYQTFQVGNVGTWVYQDGKWEGLYFFGNHISKQQSAFVTEVTTHPLLTHWVYNIQYDIWKSENAGATWTNMTNGNLRRISDKMVVSEDIPETIIIGPGHDTIYRSIDGGQSWVTRNTPPMHTLEMDRRNKNHLWGWGFAGVYESFDAGDTWVDISGGLAGFFINEGAFQEDTEGLYVSTDYGRVFYKDNTLSDWVLFNDGLPQTVMKGGLHIVPCTGKIRVSAYGRGVYESNLYNHPNADLCCPPAYPILTRSGCGEIQNITINSPPVDYQIAWYKDYQLLPEVTSSNINITETGSYTARFENGTCNSFHSDPIIISSQIPLAKSSVSSNGLSLDGVDDYVAINHADALNLGNNFTWEFWAKSNSSVSGRKYLLRKEGAYGIDIIDGTNLKFVTWGDDITFNNGFKNDDLWHHYALTGSGGNEKKLYIDGELIGTNNETYTTNQSGNPLYIGFINDPLNFSIDEFRIWNVTRTQSQIQENAICQLNCVENELVAYFPIELGTANGDNKGLEALVDFSFYNNVNTLNNFDLEGDSSNIILANKLDQVAITGSLTFCAGDSYTYSLPDLPLATAFEWIIPADWTGSSTTNSINTVAGQAGGSIQAKVSFECDTLTFILDLLDVDISAVPSSLLASSGLALDGVDDYVQIPDANHLDVSNNFSLEFWAKSNSSFLGTKFLIRKTGGYGVDIIDGTKLRFVNWGDDATFNDGFLNDGLWHHYALTANGGTERKLYIDGTLKETNMAAYDLSPSAAPLYIGYTADPLEMEMDELRIWNRTLSESEITDYLYCKLTCIDVDLLAYFPMEQGVAGGDNTSLTQLTDFSSYKNHGSFTNLNLTGSSSNIITTDKLTGQTISGITSVCNGSTYEYSISAIVGASSYSWTLPSGWTGSSTTNSIMLTAGASNGNIQVSAQLDCDLLQLTLALTQADLSALPDLTSNSNVLDLDGVDDYVVIPHQEQLKLGDNFSFEFWAKTTETTGYKYLLRKSGAYGVDIIGGDDIVFVTWGDDAHFTNGMINDGTWHHYALTANAAGGNYSRKLYRDGTFLEENINAYTTDQDPADLYIGFSSNPLTMGLDELRIWNRTLSAAEILSKFHCSLDCTPPELVAYFPFENATANGDNTGLAGPLDYSAYQNQATFVNMAQTGATSNIISDDKRTDFSNFGLASFCQGSSYTYSVTGYPDATNYTWTLPNGWTGNSSSSTITAIAGANSGNISVDITLPCGVEQLSMAVSPISLAGLPSTIANSKVLDLDGIDDYLEIPNQSHLNPGVDMTIEFWANSAQLGTWSSIIRKQEDYGIDITTTKTMAFVTFGGDAHFANTFKDDGLWHHYAFTASGGSERKLYVDGMIAGVNNDAYTIDESTNPLRIGQATTGHQIAFDEIRIWKTTKSEADIQESLFCRPDCTDETLLLYLPFEDLPAGGNNTASTGTMDYSVYSNTTNFENFALMGNASNIINNTGEQAILEFTGADSICVNRTNTYTVPALSGVVSYTWTLPSGWTGSSTTNSIEVTPNLTDGVIQVAVAFSCETITLKKEVNVQACFTGLDLAGANNYVAIKDDNSLDLPSNFSWMFWAKSDATFSGTKFLMRKVGAYGIDIQNGDDLLFVTWGDDILFNDAFQNDGQWHHYALTAANGNEKKLYVDGTLVGTDNSTYTIAGTADSLYIGFTNDPLDFSISELSIWNVTLDAAAVTGHYSCSTITPDATLTLYYDFSEGSPEGNNTAITQLVDQSNNSNSGILNNFAKTGINSNYVYGAPLAVDADTDGIGDSCDTCQGNNASGDSDSDGICDDIDNCINTDNTNQADADGDGIGDTCDICTGTDASGDSDNDGICDDIDNCINTGNSNQEDADGDGLGDTCDICIGTDASGDSDNDGICDDIDNCINTSNPTQADADEDNVGDTCDICNGDDASGDTDGDGICNDLDPNDDDDAFTDAEEINCGSDPLNASDIPMDTDGDGSCNNEDEDDDNDGIDDEFDINPLNPNICGDTDGDGCDDCAIGVDGFGAMADNLPNNDGTDTDSDGICDSGDNCVNTANTDQADADSDGIGDVCDTCIGDNSSGDTDGDGICDDQDTDKDEDGVQNDLEISCLSNPTDENSLPLDTDSDGTCDALDEDDDNDGVLDATDPDTTNPNICGDTDGDGCDDCSIGVDGFGPLSDQTPANDGTDSDQDGICDSGDNCPGLFNPSQGDDDGDGSGNECDYCTGRNLTLNDDPDFDGICND